MVHLLLYQHYHQAHVKLCLRLQTVRTPNQKERPIFTWFSRGQMFTGNASSSLYPLLVDRCLFERMPLFP